MTRIQVIIDSIAGAFGAVIGFLYGEVTGLFWALIAFMAMDYITGVVIAVINRKLSSEVGFKGLAKKLFILCFVAMGHILDAYVIGSSSVAMTAVILFYIANEGISLLENATLLGLPVPARIKEILQQIKKKGGESNE